MHQEQPTQPFYRHAAPPPAEPVPLPPAPPPRRRGCGCFARLFLLSFLLFLLLGVGGASAAGAVLYSQLAGEIEDGIAQLDNAGQRESFETTRIFDRNGHLLWEIFGEGKRTTIPLASIPVAVQQATVAIEDDTFYQNIGLDAPSLLAAILANLRNPDARPVGGSTITQQLVRHLAFDYEERTSVSYSRKLKEIILARIMTERYSKDEILTLYLNEIYYGNLAYGIEAAAQTYFAKPATDLSLAEASLLAALPQSPVELDPLTNLEGAKARQWIVLNLMAEEGYISRDQVEPTYFEPLTFAPQEVSLVAPHFAVYVRQLLEAQYGAEMVANGGLQVTTSLDLDYQRLAENLARQHVASIGPEHNLTNAALVALKPGSGEILAMLGSVDYHDESIDGNVNVALSLQQPGSAIKPLTYAAGLAPDPQTGDAVWQAADILWDVPVTYEQADGSGYTPQNYDGRFHGPLRLRAGLANSYNIPAVLVLQELGVPRFLEFAAALGISSFGSDAAQYGLAITLGGAELTPLELTGAYAVLANSGGRIPPAAILRVAKSDGTVLFEYTPPTPEPALDPRVAFLISDILDDDAARVPAMGQNNPLALPFPAGAKTGTTNDFRDNWTVGYTPGLVVGVWTGNTDNSPMINISGLTGAAPLWADYMQAVYSSPAMQAVLQNNGAAPPTDFLPPAGLEVRPICNLGSLSRGATDCSLGESEWFLVNTRPEEPTPPPPDPVVVWQALDPGVWRVPALSLSGLPEELQVGGDAELPPPNACFFAAGTPTDQLPPDTASLVFLAAPRNRESLKGAYEWGEAHDLPVFPPVACSEALLAASRPGPGGRGDAYWRILSPQPGDSVSGILPVIGTADFDPQKIQFYKVEIGVGANPEQWITMGETHNTPVVNGTLERLVAQAFEPGIYSLRLVLVRWDGNYAGEPDVITITIE